MKLRCFESYNVGPKGGLCFMIWERTTLVSLKLCMSQEMFYVIWIYEKLLYHYEV